MPRRTERPSFLDKLTTRIVRFTRRVLSDTADKRKSVTKLKSIVDRATSRVIKADMDVDNARFNALSTSKQRSLMDRAKRLKVRKQRKRLMLSKAKKKASSKRRRS